MLDVHERTLVSGTGIQEKFLPPVALALFTLITRVLCLGSLYFADGPHHIQSILEKVYVIQPPGYWLFNRIGGLFPDPVVAVSAMNVLFSVAGVVVFYYTALFFTGRRNAFLAALAYSSIFYIWFSGEVHSTYASQALFPIAVFYVLLRYERDRSSLLLWLAAVIFAVGAGLRPSDGVFLIPMLAYYSAIRLRRGKAAIFLGLILILCLAWIIPTGLAYRQSPGSVPGLEKTQAGTQEGTTAYLRRIVGLRSILTGVNSRSMANVARYVLPLAVAVWPVLAVACLSLIRNWKDWRMRMMLVWIVPGSLFFIFSYIADAPYLTFLSAAILLLAVGAPRMMAVTAVWNAALFLCFIPIPSQRLLPNVLNCYVGKYTSYALQHHWQPMLSQVQKWPSKISGVEAP
jgi:4-amino-4-deoxy-L-arabinose transferase-like glycosyltransferase